jgi:apolipoprotein N-acyltransferase
LALKHLNEMMSLSKILLSFVLVAFGQPSIVSWLAIPAAGVGFALFWSGAERKFWPATIWFTAVQLVQLDWLASPHYMGPGILVVYVLLSFAIGAQFGWLTTAMRTTWLSIFGIAGFWVLMEWVRLFLFSGFPWNPVGMALANPYSIQFASLFGIYGLSFWVIFTNLIALKNRVLWLPMAALPYVFGVCHQLYWEERHPPARTLSVALVQTALIPEQREPKEAEYMHPFEQWNRVLKWLKEIDRLDLIVLPEGSYRNILYPYVAVKAIWEVLGTPEDFPPLEGGYAEQNRPTNLFWLQSLSNHFEATVIAGLDGEGRFNSAFHLTPNGPIHRYDKQILVPIGEYIPLEFMRGFFRNHFGIQGSFDQGSGPKIFPGTIPIAASICLEETYTHLIRENRQLGAELLVNITNDVWFPNTRLPQHHFDHGRIRSAENGVFNLRACNTGVTGMIDCFGNVVKTMPETEAGILHLEVPVYSIPTLYTKLGDTPILAICGLFSGLLFLPKRRKS